MPAIINFNKLKINHAPIQFTYFLTYPYKIPNNISESDGHL